MARDSHVMASAATQTDVGGPHELGGHIGARISAVEGKFAKSIVHKEKKLHRTGVWGDGDISEAKEMIWHNTVRTTILRSV